MLDLGLNKAEHAALLSALRSDHRIRIRLSILNRNEKPVSSLSAPINRVVAGSVQVDADAEITRSLDITVLDPLRELKFEAGSPADGALYADRFISVRYQVWVPDVIEGWVSIPVFWGPITAFQRTGGEVTIEAQGKEALLLAPHYATDGYKIAEGTRIDDAIRRVARRAGERRFDIQRARNRIGKARNVNAQAQPWLVLKGGDEDSEGKRIPGLVEQAAGDRFIFYNGRGRLTMRRLDQRASFVFRSGTNGTVISQPSVNHDSREVPNKIVVRGKKPEGKPRPVGEAVLPPTHPLSPRSLAWNGEPRHRTEFIDTELSTKTACEQRARRILRRRVRAEVEGSFECLPIPMLEENDFVRLTTDEWSITFRLRSFTIPLTATDSASVNHNKKVKKWRRKRRYRRG